MVFFALPYTLAGCFEPFGRIFSIHLQGILKMMEAGMSSAVTQKTKF
jgi:hypothetical protein